MFGYPVGRFQAVVADHAGHRALACVYKDRIEAALERRAGFA